MARLRAAHLVLPCAALTLLTTGCSLVVGGPLTSAQQTYGVDGTVRALSVTTHGGDIEIVPVDAGGAVKVTEKAKYNGDKPQTTHTVKDGRLTLTAEECSLDHHCEVGYRVLLPRGASVDLHTSGGDVTVRGASGGITADTSGGDVTVTDTEARTAKVKTSGGNVELTLGAVPDDVSARTSGGNVTLRIPKGTYAVDAGTSGGNRTVSVTTDSGSAHKISARTSGGDVSVLSGK
ncbi:MULTISPECIES: DUF4097 family beta strand repeat-containing protein [unclassified Streptomyces]|uniref:DUF4097 family beta strand repeat-containing protein n=1 Tax=unclassified Streptomyces TaxID=2593676 RepID=UPI000C2805B3|nr:DUF4097 family beta strand repeat-containing protein [Streptomyces sp. CB02959]PJN40690.1 hypothetical protein CG747_10105 [Streptomyces sp. CB02959]